jgi:hypothetical protein
VKPSLVRRAGVIAGSVIAALTLTAPTASAAVLHNHRCGSIDDHARYASIFDIRSHGELCGYARQMALYIVKSNLDPSSQYYIRLGDNGIRWTESEQQESDYPTIPDPFDHVILSGRGRSITFNVTGNG